MRRELRDIIAGQEIVDALKVCCAACSAKADESCMDGEGRPRKPHKVRIKIGRWSRSR